VFVDFFQVATNLSDTDFLITNAELQDLKLTLSLPSSTIYHASVSAVTQGIVTMQLPANSVDEGNFGSYDFAIVYTGGTGTGDPLEGDELKIYPNPTLGLININIPSGMGSGARFGLYSMIGQAMHVQPVTDGTRALELDLGHLPPGIYLLEITAANGTWSRKVVLEGH
jgi:hypothetical protein